jgi:hypothetical protein
MHLGGTKKRCLYDPFVNDLSGPGPSAPCMRRTEQRCIWSRRCRIHAGPDFDADNDDNGGEDGRE